MKRYVVDGSTICDFGSLCHAFAVAVNAPDLYFGRDFPSFDDCFFGYVPFEKPCEFVWTHADVARSALDAAQLEAHWSAFLDCEFYGDHARRMVGLARTGKRTLFDDVIESIRSVGDRNSNHRLVLTLED